MRSRLLVSLVIVAVFLTAAFVASLSANWFYLHFGFEIVWILLGIGAIAAFLLLALPRRVRTIDRS